MNKLTQAPDSQEQTLAHDWAGSLWFRILLIMVFGLGTFFRLSDLGKKMYSHDEAYTSLYAAGYLGGDVFNSIWDGKDKSVQDIQYFLRPNDEKDITDVLLRIAIYRPHEAPLFFLLEHYWMYLAGYTPAAMRGLAAIFGLLSIPVMYWFGNELFQSRRIALLCTILFSISPFHILFAQDAKPYSLWTLATLLASAALLRIRKDNLRDWLTYSFTLIIGLYTQQLFILVIIAHGFFIAGIYFLSHKKIYKSFWAACLVALVAYTPWLFFLVTNWQRAARQLSHLNMQLPWYRYIQRWILNFSSPFIDLEFSSGNLIPYILRVLMLVFIAASFLYFMRYSSQQQKLLLLLIYIFTAGVLIISDLLLGGTLSINGRYFVPANIATIMVLAYFLSVTLDKADPNTYIRWRLFIIMLASIGIFSNINSLQAETWWNKELGRVNTDFVHEIDKDKTLLIVSGSHPTNLGDILLLSFEVDRDVHFRLIENPADIQFSSNYLNTFWFPSTYQEVQKIREEEGIRLREVVAGTLWRIDRLEE